MHDHKRFIKSLLIMACLLGASHALSACRASSFGAGTRYDLKGRVVSVDKKGKQLIIAHEPVAGYMDAMTMGFNVKDQSVLDYAQPEDNIQATLIVDGDRSWLEGVILARLSAEVPTETGASAASEPETGAVVPDFTLVNQDGKPVSLNQYRGRALALTFIYTRCPLPDFCPLMNQNFAAIDSALQRDAELYAKTHLLSITVDPEFDTPDVLKSFGAAFATRQGEPPFAHWEFATGSPEEIRNIAAFFGLSYQQDADQIIHSLRTAIISPDGKVVKVYRGNEWKPDELIKDLQIFKGDGHGH
jgi:protein SCO1/2